ncbi:MAG: hypothetical protein MJ180_00390 [Candidatus Gastranaerophilales bacterium]|nr:hypothetical protein [Candidatus Gastranaerophilales bacterium]
MIIKAFAEALQTDGNKEPCVFLQSWLKKILLKEPENHVENVIHTEFFLQTTQDNNTIVASNSKTGKALLQSLYNFCLSYENFLFARWLHKKKVNDFMNK